MGVWVCVLLLDEQCDGFKKQVVNFFDRAFRLTDPVDKVEFFDWIRQFECSVEKS